MTLEDEEINVLVKYRDHTGRTALIMGWTAERPSAASGVTFKGQGRYRTEVHIPADAVIEVAEADWPYERLELGCVW